MLTNDDFFSYLMAEYNQPFSGWDFSYLAGRRRTFRPEDTWDYMGTVKAAIIDARSLLDMDTGGGELLSSLQPLPPYTCATEGYAPNVALARQRLEPLGVKVYEVDESDFLPFADDKFDLVINRHGAYEPREVMRVLKSGKRFITQQVGEETNAKLHELLGRVKPDSNWDLAHAVGGLKAVEGWHILEQREELLITRYYDVGAIVYYLKAVAWEIPDFSVEKYFDKLLEVRDLIEANGFVEVPFHQFFIVAEKGA
jgi:hypothetical protein